jgi:hypothetical protein
MHVLFRIRTKNEDLAMKFGIVSRKHGYRISGTNFLSDILGKSELCLLSIFTLPHELSMAAGFVFQRMKWTKRKS